MSDSTEEQHFDARFPARRKLIWFLTISFFLFLIVFTAVEIENWRGLRAWKEFKQEMESKGEKLDFESLIPPPVPNESNFASISFFTNQFDYYRDSSGKVVWGDTNAVSENRLSIYAEDTSIDSPGFGLWIVGRRTDLTEWADYYRKSNRAHNETNTNSAEPLKRTDEAAREILFALAKADDTLDELYEASKRPYSRAPIHYGEGHRGRLPHLARIKQASQHLSLRASSNLALNNTDDGARDVILSLRIGNISRDEPLLISHLVRAAISTISIHPLWEGLSEHRWDDDHLKQFQDELAKFDYLETYRIAMEGERGFSNSGLDSILTNRAAGNGLVYSWDEDVEFAFDFDSLKNHFSEKSKSVGFHLIPDGWIYQNKLVLSRSIQMMLTNVDQEGRIVRVQSAKANAPLNSLTNSFPPYRAAAEMLLPAYGKITMKLAFQQTAIDLATVACALERFRIAHGHYPDALDELSPRFIGKVPHDVINGEPLKYRRKSDGKFVVYSVGWNETDDGGHVAVTATGNYRAEEGDWVWKFPTNAAPMPSAKNGLK